MFLKSVIIVINIIYVTVTGSLQTSNVCTAEKKCFIEPQGNEVISDIFDSFVNFAGKLKRIFHSTAEDLNEKRIKFKNILHNIVDNIRTDRNLTNSSTSSTTPVSKFTTDIITNPPFEKSGTDITQDLGEYIEVSAREELPVKETKLKNLISEPSVQEFMKFIDEYSAYDDISTKQNEDLKHVLPVQKRWNTSIVTINNTVKLEVIPSRNQQMLPKEPNTCKLKSIIRSIIKILQDKQNHRGTDSVLASPDKHFESSTVPNDHNFMINKKTSNKQEIIRRIRHTIHKCLEVIFKDLFGYIEVKVNSKANKEYEQQQKVKNDKRHFTDDKAELIEDVIDYFNNKYLQNNTVVTPQYEEDYVQFSSSTNIYPFTAFKPTPKAFRYYIKKISKSKSYNKVNNISKISSSTAITEGFSNDYEEVSFETTHASHTNTTNLHSNGNKQAVSKLLNFINEHKEPVESTNVTNIRTSQLVLNNLKSTAPTQNGSQKAISPLKVFLKFINLYSKKNESITTTVRPTKPASHTLKQPLVFSHGYKVELHHIQTIDGYKLTAHRILPHHTVMPIAKRRNRIALLHHGLLGSADDWVLLGPKKALPYLLTNVGYDVWLTNARGNKYSHSSANRRVNASEYWKFSFHEIGLYDLSAVIDHIRETTDGNSRIDFIGHSMGATALLVLLSTSPQYNLLLRSAILLAPLAYMYKSQGMIRLLSEYQKRKGYKSLYFLGETEFMPSLAFPNKVRRLYCKGDRISCLNPWLLIASGGLNMQNKTLEKIILNHVPAGGSTKTIVHYTQLVRSGQFQMFDLGAVDNIVRYGARAPPAYRLNDVTVPVAIFSSQYDQLSNAADIKNLVSNLLNFIGHHVIKKTKFTHTDFVWGESAPLQVYYRIIDLLDQEMYD